GDGQRRPYERAPQHDLLGDEEGELAGLHVVRADAHSQRAARRGRSCLGASPEEPRLSMVAARGSTSLSTMPCTGMPYSASTAAPTSSRGVDPARTTISAPSRSRHSVGTSASGSTGGQSRITKSNCSLS